MWETSGGFPAGGGLAASVVFLVGRGGGGGDFKAASVVFFGRGGPTGGGEPATVVVFGRGGAAGGTRMTPAHFGQRMPVPGGTGRGRRNLLWHFAQTTTGPVGAVPASLVGFPCRDASAVGRAGPARTVFFGATRNTAAHFAHFTS
jgi:hypothetical protein